MFKILSTIKANSKRLCLKHKLSYLLIRRTNIETRHKIKKQYKFNYINKVLSYSIMLKEIIIEINNVKL
jgi:hypothetical protein